VQSFFLLNILLIAKAYHKPATSLILDGKGAVIVPILREPMRKVILLVVGAWEARTNNHIPFWLNG
jgi:hypothetical protein